MTLRPPFSFDAARRATLAALVLATLSAAAPARAQPAEAPLAPAARAAVIERLATHVQQRFVFADVGAATAAALRAELGTGAFDTATTAEALARRLTERLQALTRDKHLRVYRARADGGHVLGSEAQLRQANFGFERVQRLPGNIGYLDLRFFVNRPEARAAAVATMNWLAHTDALIVDLRRNGGGDPELIRFLQSYLFDEPTLLNTLHWRDDARPGGYRIDEFRTTRDVEGRRYGATKPVWVLTSRDTFSGGEEFAYNLKARKRGTIVGETTGGGAHPGAQFDLGQGLAAHLSTGRAVNPVTQANWEGSGVAPDIEVPAAAALRRAQVELLKQLIAAEPEAPRRAGLQARLKSLEDGAADA